MNRTTLISASQLLNQDYLQAEKQLSAINMTTNIYDAISQSGAFDLDSKIQTEKPIDIDLTDLTNEKAQLQSDQPTLISFDTNVKKKLARDSLDKKQNKLIEIASSLTRDIQPNNSNVDMSMNRIGNYEIWRDQDDIAIINAKDNKIVAYGNNSQDFFPIKIEESRLDQFNSPDRLLGKITQYNPQMELKYDSNTVANAHEQLRPLEPVFKALNQQETRPEKSFGQKLSASVKDFVKSLQKFTNKGSQKIGALASELLLDAKERTNSIGSKLLSERIMKHSLQKFEQAFERTGENSYSLGDYTIQKIEDQNQKDRNILLVVDKNQGILLSLNMNSDKTQKPELRFYQPDLKKLNQAANYLVNPNNQAIGSIAKENEYQSKVTGVIKELASYKNGKTQLANTDKYIIKTEDSISLQDTRGNNLIVADSSQNSSFASTKELDNIKKAIQVDKYELRQQELVDKIAPTIKQYLDINQRTTIDKDNFIVSYDPQSNVINYQDKSDPENFLQAEQTNKGWSRIKSNITPAKEKYFEDVARKTNDYVQKQNLVSNQNQKRGGRSR